MAKPLTATKYYQLTRELREELQAKRPGEPLDTVADLKSRFNVSQATVTRALQRLRSDGLIYRPAGRNRLVVSDHVEPVLRRVAVVRPSWPSPDYDAVTGAVMAECRRRGWGVEVSAQQADVATLDLDRAVAEHDAAVLLTSVVRLPDPVLQWLRRPKRPVVTVLEVPEDEAVPGVATDDHRVGEIAVEHLAELGHREILAVVNEPPSRSIFERTMGWRDAMSKLGVKHRALMVDCAVRRGEDSLDLSYRFLCRWLGDAPPRFTAVFCVSWTGALAMMRALREVLGWRPPADFSLVTYAGESLIVPYLDPPLTSIQTDMTRYGCVVADQLERLMEDPDAPPRQIRVAPILREGQSVRPRADMP